MSKDYNFQANVNIGFPKKHRLGPQNGSGSSGPKKMSKIVSCAETKKLKETMVGSQVEYVGGHQYPLDHLETLGDLIYQYYKPWLYKHSRISIIVVG